MMLPPSSSPICFNCPKRPCRPLSRRNKPDLSPSSSERGILSAHCRICFPLSDLPVPPLRDTIERASPFIALHESTRDHCEILGHYQEGRSAPSMGVYICSSGNPPEYQAAH